MSSADDSLPPGRPTLERAFEALVSTFNERQINYAIIGGIALIQHTRVRTTDDIDALLLVPQIGLPGLFEALRRRGFTVDLQTNVREFLDDGFTALRFDDVQIDLMRPLIPTYNHVLERAISANVLGQQVRISSAEGLIVMKLIAMRLQDQADVKDLLRSYAGKLDLEFVRAEMNTFTPVDDPRRAKFDEWVLETSHPD
ncbi:MAG TPA: nucleotidyltransferase [Phycisphaerae bacterium]|nr:nucleotidyltransferase [Phycisphaerae bacterium]